jgi:hypothetical protein
MSTKSERLEVEKVIRDSIGWDNCRWTGTLEKRGGKWVVVQMHFSFPKDE